MPTTAQARDFLSSRIVAEAARLCMPLSDIERQMLHFSDGPALTRGMQEAAEAFDREYDESAYKAKIAHLVQSLQPNLSPEEHSQWHDAVLKLRDGDHYLITLIDAANRKPSILNSPWLPTSERPTIRRPYDFLRLILVAIVVMLACLSINILLPDSCHRH